MFSNEPLDLRPYLGQKPVSVRRGWPQRLFCPVDAPVYAPRGHAQQGQS
jgi:hypothetical protein